MLAAPYMKALSAIVGQDVSVDEAGAVAFSLAGRHLLLQWNDEERAFVAYAEVGPLLGWNDAEVCRELLSANFLLLETQGASLSYDDVNNMVALNRLIPVCGLEPEAFITIVNRMLLTADLWNERLQALMARQEAADRANAARLRELSGEAAEEAATSPFLIRV